MNKSEEFNHLLQEEVITKENVFLVNGIQPPAVTVFFTFPFERDTRIENFMSKYITNNVRSLLFWKVI